MVADPGAPEGGSTAPNRGRRVAGGIAFVVVATVLQLLRQSGVEMWRTVWAEDAGAFYSTALERPLHEVVFQGYAGYGLVLPRILAAFGVLLPPEWFSYYSSVVSCLIVSLLALFVYWASAPLLRSQVRQAILAVSMVSLPVLALELLGTIANLHWFLPVACLFAVLFPVERPSAIAVRVVIAVLAPLTSPLCVLLVPIGLWHGWRALRGAAPRSTLIVPSALLAGSIGQLLMVATTQMPPDQRPPFDDLVVNLTKLYSTRVVTSGLFGVRVTESLWDLMGYGLAAIAVVAVLVLLALGLRGATTTSRWVEFGFAAASVGVFVFSMYQRSGLLPALLSKQDGSFNFGGTRYEVFPVFLLLIALLVPKGLEWPDLRDGRAPAPVGLAADARANLVALVVGAVWVGVAVIPSYRLVNGRSTGPDWPANVDRAQEECRLTGQPSAIVRFSPPPAWAIQVRCDDLEALAPPSGGSEPGTAGR